MKTVKTSNGNKTIEDCSEPVALLKIREILTEHRNTLINRLILDLPTYVNYRFNANPSKDQIQNLVEKLYSMKHLPINLDLYSSAVNEILSNENTHLSAEPFYKEIDSSLSWELRPNQMVSVK